MTRCQSPDDDVCVQMIQTVDCSVHSSPCTTSVDSNEHRCPNEISEIAVSPVDRCRVVVNISRRHPIVLSVSATTNG